MAKKTSRKRLPRANTQARWHAENDLQTLKTAEEIRSSPKRFTDAKKIGVTQVTAIKKVLTKKR